MHNTLNNTTIILYYNFKIFHNILVLPSIAFYFQQFYSVILSFS